MWLKEKLLILRKQHGMTQQELAERLDVSRQAISSWERGTAEPSTENLVSIGKLFGVSVDALVNENAQVQAESAVQVAVAEKKETAEKHSKYGIAKIVGIVLFAIAVVFAVYIGLRKGEQNPVPMENINKDAVNVSEAVTVPIDLKE